MFALFSIFKQKRDEQRKQTLKKFTLLLKIFKED
jgi:hypothetical protein